MSKDKDYTKLWVHRDFKDAIKKESAIRNMSIIDLSKDLAENDLSIRPVNKRVNAFEKFKFTK